jgi:signal transduction histidine kinase
VGAGADQRAGNTPGFFVLLILLLIGVGSAVPAGVQQALAAPIAALLWVAFIAASSLLTLPALPRVNLDVSLSAPLAVSAAVLFPAPLVVLMNFVGLTNEREFRRTTTVWMSLFNRAQLGLAAGAAALAVEVQPFGEIVGTVAAVVVYNIVNTALVSIVLWVRGQLEFSEAAKGSTAPFPRFAIDYGLVTLLALFIVIAYEVVGGPWVVALLALPLWLGYSAMRSARESEDRAQELAVRVRVLETLHGAATELLASRRPDHALVVARGGLANALDTEDVDVALDGAVQEGLERIEVPGAEPAALGIPPESSERAREVVEALAGLLGMTLTRQTLEQELAEVERARAKLSGQILEEGTRERSRIALELHDDVLPALAAAQIQADNARSAIGAGRLDRANELARAARDAAQQSIGRLREVLDTFQRQILVPGALREGLVEALEELKVQHGVEGGLCAPDELPDIPFAIEILLLETVRGCLANVARHANGERVEIVLEPKNDHILLDVRDDGCGFDPGAVAEGHHGLALMRQRVELARGRFDVASAPGEGTTVHVEVPL